VILVALVVLVVPELLSGPGGRATRPQATAEEAPLRSVRLELGDELRGAAALRADAPSPQPAPAPQSSQPAATHSPGRAGAEITEAPAAQTSQPSVAQSAQSQPAEPAPPSARPAVRGSGPPQAAGAGQPAGGHAKGAHQAPSRTVHHERSAHAQPPGRGWAVQVGSFESRGRADRLVQRLRIAGFTAFVSQSESHGRRWYRVRVGPEHDRTAARAMVVRLHAAGRSGSIVPP
jgi:DedD protein